MSARCASKCAQSASEQQKCARNWNGCHIGREGEIKRYRWVSEIQIDPGIVEILQQTAAELIVVTKHGIDTGDPSAPIERQ